MHSGRRSKLAVTEGIRFYFLSLFPSLHSTSGDCLVVCALFRRLGSRPTGKRLDGRPSSRLLL